MQEQQYLNRECSHLILSLQQGNIRLTAIIVMAKLKYSDSETNILIKEISDKKNNILIKSNILILKNSMH